MREANKIADYLMEIYSSARTKLIDGVIVYDENDNQYIDLILEKLMKLREENYDFYLDCISLLIFQADYYHSTIRLLENIEDQEEEINEEEMLSEIRYLIELIEESPNIIYFDNQLAEDNFEALRDIISFYGEFLIEEAEEFSYFDLYYDLTACEIYTKFIRPEILQETFTEAIRFGIEEYCEGLVDMLSLLYENSEETDKSYELHQYIMQSYNTPKYSECIAEYLNEILWNTYAGGIILKNNGDESVENDAYIMSYENEPSFIFRKCQELINSKEIPEVFDLFLNNHKIENLMNESTIKKVEEELVKEQTKAEIKTYINYRKASLAVFQWRLIKLAIL